MSVLFLIVIYTNYRVVHKLIFLQEGLKNNFKKLNNLILWLE